MKIIYIILLFAVLTGAASANTTAYPEGMAYLITIPNYTSNDSVVITAIESGYNLSIEIQLNEYINTEIIPLNNSTAFSYNESGIVRIYSDNPVALYHNSTYGAVYIDSSYSDALRSEEKLIIIYEVLDMIGYIIFIVMMWIFAVVVAKNQTSQILLAMTATMTYIMALLEWISMQTFLVSLLLMVLLMGLNYVVAIRGHNE